MTTAIRFPLIIAWIPFNDLLMQAWINAGHRPLSPGPGTASSVPGLHQAPPATPSPIRGLANDVAIVIPSSPHSISKHGLVMRGGGM